MIEPYYKTELGELYLGDCLEVMKELEDKSVDLVLTDPPYGVKRDKGFGGSRGFSGLGRKIESRKYKDDWDSERPPKETFKLILEISQKAIVFGGNFFADLLPQGKHWIVWDKLNTMPTFGDCELLWTNIERQSVKKITFEYNGLIGKEFKRFHPTQKPEQLISILLSKYSKVSDLIFDPFIGSGTLAVACEKLKRRWIGIEISEKYCEIAKKRIQQEANQMKLF